MPKCQQELILSKLNYYIKHKKRKHILEPGGYCHGLTLLWLYKMSEGKEKWFYDITNKIIRCKLKNLDQIEIDIEKFLAHIEWLQNPNKYVKNIQQLDIDKLTDTYRDYSISYSFTAETLKSNLNKLISSNRMTCISGPNHTIGVFRRNNKFYIYDPNSITGLPQSTNKLNELQSEIISALFKKTKLQHKDIPLHINVVSRSKINHKTTNNLVYKILKSSANADGISSGLSTITLACESGNVQQVKFLLDNGANINQQCNQGKSLLFTTSEFNHIQLVKYLISRGANIKLPDNNGDTPLHVSAHYGYNEIAKLLLSKGADPIQRNYTNSTPLYWALNNSQWDTAIILLSKINNISSIPTTDLRILRNHKADILQTMDYTLPNLINIKEAQHAKKMILQIYKITATSHNNLFFCNNKNKQPNKNQISFDTTPLLLKFNK